MPLSFSRRLAVLAGVLVPAGETARRWHMWREWPPFLFDDYLMGALLLYAAWLVKREPRRGQRYLAAAWGFAVGLGYASFFAHLQSYLKDPSAPDPAPIPHLWVVVIIGAGWLLAVVSLLSTLRRLPDNP